MSDVRQRQLVVHEDIKYPELITREGYETAIRDAADKARAKLQQYARMSDKGLGGWVIDESTWNMSVIPVASNLGVMSKRLTMSVIIKRPTDG